MGEIASWPNRNSSNTIQKLGDVKEEDSVVQIINDVLGKCKKRTPKVGNQGEDAIRTSGDFVDACDRGDNQTRWFNFCKEVCLRGDT